MNAGNTAFNSDSIRAALTSFWSSALAIERTPKGLAIAVPQTSADGWQLVLHLCESTPGVAKLHDAGHSLGLLLAHGQNIETPSLSAHIDSILSESSLQRDGLEIYCWLSLPINATQIHVFAEALSAITHLHVLHDPTIRTLDIADKTLRRVFADHKVEAQAAAKLSGKTERNVVVDYLVHAKHPVAFEILRRRGRLLSVMEQWGYRWQDLRKTTPSLMPVMLFDPASQDVDDGSRAIGEEVCSLFCAFDETDRIHAVLDRAGARS